MKKYYEIPAVQVLNIKQESLLAGENMLVSSVGNITDGSEIESKRHTETVIDDEEDDETIIENKFETAFMQMKQFRSVWD